MPRYLISTGMLPNTLMTRELAEAVEIFGLLYVHGSGMLDGLIPNKNFMNYNKFDQNNKCLGNTHYLYKDKRGDTTYWNEYFDEITSEKMNEYMKKIKML
mgnify:CR=1 FL=1